MASEDNSDMNDADVTDLTHFRALDSGTASVEPESSGVPRAGSDGHAASAVPEYSGARGAPLGGPAY
eukprot:4467650-Alexandrium_andersonii.AAC.1